MPESWNLNSDDAKRAAKEARLGGALLPEGSYPMRCVDIQYKKTLTQGLDSWNLQLEVASGEFAGKTVKDGLFFSERAIGRLLNCLEAFGLKPKELEDVVPRDREKQQLLIGRMASVTVAHTEDDKGRTWANVTFDGYGPLPEEDRVDYGDIPF